ncbi:hypothetical protein JTE90_027034 [Oedothorax gibbosus]|uniref:Uncharacterized protein n=1 Tax=Oedothorax gibbosus TaxID=931172 RepID=A0AAV6UTZ2_9ARAC|nr:hypothetical protein JTE90_027034 [Oedothorax gibbosus]
MENITQGSGGSTDKKSIMWMVIWCLILLAIGLIWSAFCAALYIILSVFLPCFPKLENIVKFLRENIEFAYFCAQNMMDRKPLC